MKDLSIIIVSYNTLDVTRQCFEHLEQSLLKSPSVSTEIILVDNNSTDGSVDMLKNCRSDSKNIETKTLFLKENIGFSKGNNKGLALVTGKYVLFLNSDVYVQDVNFADLIHYLDEHEKVGVLSVRVELPNGKIDPASHRGFPSVWNAFTYFSKLEKFFSPVPLLNRVFGGYHLTHLDLKTIHEIDSPTGAFYLTRADILKDLHGFDEDYFMYGEDLDWSYRIKNSGWKIIYNPTVSITHLKKKSGRKNENLSIRYQTTTAFYETMKLFYRKHYSKRYPYILTWIILSFIDLKKIISLALIHHKIMYD